MSPFFAGPPNNPTTVVLFKQSSIRTPAQKIMLAEEQASHKGNEGVNVGGSTQSINHGRRLPPGGLDLVHHSSADVPPTLQLRALIAT
jgi:hypothetical protein